MAENLMNSEHKATNEKYREGYDRIFGKNFDTKDAKFTVKFRCSKELAEKIKGPAEKSLDDVIKKITKKGFGHAHIRSEGKPLHPDDLSGDLTQEQYDRQLAAYNKEYDNR